MYYPPSELVLNSKGQVYHLGVGPEVIAQNVILVGDQDRVALISAHFDTIEHTSQHREFVVHTGTCKGKRITVISTGIGTDNIDIVLNELDALVNIDLTQRCDKEQHTALSIVRIGTCGILQAEIPLFSHIISSFAYGLDNIPYFYQIGFSETEEHIRKHLTAHLQLPSTIQPYAIQANESLVKKLENPKSFTGITVTSSGFYGPQGRNLRLPLSTDRLNEKLEDFRLDALKINNFEMECSALLVLGKSLGHQCTTICLGIANRQTKEFAKSYEVEMEELIVHVLSVI